MGARLMLQLTDGVTTVTLSGGTAPILACNYFPSPPERNGDGYNDVTETAQVVMEGTPGSVIGAFNSIERLLRSAADRNKSPDRRVFLLHSVAGQPVQRSEVLEGRALWDGDPLYRRMGGSTTAVKAAVIWKRRYFWEANAETALSTANIVNGNSGNNTWTWNGIDGTLPAPVRLTLTNTSAGAWTAPRFYVLNDAPGGLAAVSPFVTPATAAGSWAAGSTHGTLRWIAAISSGVAAAMKGERYRVIGAFSAQSSGADLYMRVGVYAVLPGPFYLPLATGPDVKVGSKKLLDFGSFDLPPAGNISGSQLALIITVSSPSAGSATLSWLHVYPAAPALTLQQSGFTTAVGAAVVHDGIDGAAYMLQSAVKYSIVEPSGELLLHPGQTNKLRLLMSEETAFDPARAVQVSGAYRPRRLTV